MLFYVARGAKLVKSALRHPAAKGEEGGGGGEEERRSGGVGRCIGRLLTDQVRTLVTG